jgi:hypothetical protein
LWENSYDLLIKGLEDGQININAKCAAGTKGNRAQALIFVITFSEKIQCGNPQGTCTETM